MIPDTLSQDATNVAGQAFAGLLWSKQYYHYVVKPWLEGDSAQPPPPAEREAGRNHEWIHLYNADVLLMPDKWECPWYAAWDLAFHCVALAVVDPDFAKEHVLLEPMSVAQKGITQAYEIQRRLKVWRPRAPVMSTRPRDPSPSGPPSTAHLI